MSFVGSALRSPHWYSFQNRDGHAELEVVESERGPAREVALAEHGVRVEVPKVEREHLVEQLVGLGVVTRIDGVLRFEEELRAGVVTCGRGRQPVRGPAATASVATCGVMRRILTVQRERRESEHRDVEPHRRHVAREVRMPRVRPLLLRRHGDDRASDLVAHRRA
ncbi:MAG: hypothetical protein IT384_31205 [Deltaproteobacteria bacterium]|nr:hypothetical protein [Deltaproteobacteria bacterium]